MRGVQGQQGDTCGHRGIIASEAFPFVFTMSGTGTSPPTAEVDAC